MPDPTDRAEARAIRKIPKPRRPKIPAEIRIPIKMPAAKGDRKDLGTDLTAHRRR